LFNQLDKQWLDAGEPTDMSTAKGDCWLRLGDQGHPLILKVANSCFERANGIAEIMEALVSSGGLQKLAFGSVRSDKFQIRLVRLRGGGT
jgi:hypothetical protein